jgi:hypothetical protein
MTLRYFALALILQSLPLLVRAEAVDEKPAAAEKAAEWDFKKVRFAYYGIESHGQGVGVLFHDDVRKWLSTGIDLNVFRGIARDMTLSDGYYKYPMTAKTDVMPRVQASFFLHPPLPILKFIGFGMGMEAYYFRTRLRSENPLFPFGGKNSGFHYNVFYPVLEVGIPFGGKTRPYRFAATLEWARRRTNKRSHLPADRRL